MAYLQNNSAFIPNGLTRCLSHSNQCDETNRSLAKRFGDAESCAQCPIYYDQRPVCFADRTICGGVYRSVLLNDELPNLPPNSYGTLAKRKPEKVYLKRHARMCPMKECMNLPHSSFLIYFQISF